MRKPSTPATNQAVVGRLTERRAAGAQKPQYVVQICVRVSIRIRHRVTTKAGDEQLFAYRPLSVGNLTKRQH